MPRKTDGDVVHVLIALHEEGFPERIEAYGTRFEAEKEAWRIARLEGYVLKNCRFDDSGELIASSRRGDPLRTGIYLKTRTIIRKPRTLKEKA